MTLVSGQTYPARSLAVIPQPDEAGGIPHPDGVLGIRLPLLGGQPIPSVGFIIVS